MEIPAGDAIQFIAYRISVDAAGSKAGSREDADGPIEIGDQPITQIIERREGAPHDHGLVASDLAPERRIRPDALTGHETHVLAGPVHEYDAAVVEIGLPIDAFQETGIPD